ncbi:Protein CBG23707 [Caenorhabditis briggsae]|uniref:Protein CBG23707 n=1 Tax=Caenorhabditis briggsae TaxID=6238 RepID=A8WJ43_CAEBR|nr:Protein CBG23707 [Caenorhabditis briggsae]CAP20487.1 Protein CBG23707 [Caenorhabditis briggsae]
MFGGNYQHSSLAENLTFFLALQNYSTPIIYSFYRTHQPYSNYKMFHVQMEIHSFNSDLDLKKAGTFSNVPEMPEKSMGERKLMDRALEEKRKGFRRHDTTYM